MLVYTLAMDLAIDLAQQHSPTPANQHERWGEAARLFKALSDPTRLHILHFLAQAPQTCCDSVCAYNLEAISGLSQPTISHHMKILVSVGLVSSHKQGKWMHYSLCPQGFQTLAKLIPTFCP